MRSNFHFNLIIIIFYILACRFCYESALNPKKVKGRVVYCQLGSYGTEAVVKGFGGIGTILDNDQYLDLAQIFMAPATIVNNTIGQVVTNYIKSSRYIYIYFFKIYFLVFIFVDKLWFNSWLLKKKSLVIGVFLYKY